MIDNWDIFEQMIDYSYNRCVFSESKFHPVLFTEPANNPKQKRERLMEVMFEKYNVPAFYLVKNAVLAAFASGRTNALILDAGATHTSAIPIYDGHVVQQAVVKSAIGGNMITEQLKMLLAEQNIPIVPPYLIGSKAEVAENEPPKWEKKKNLPQVTQSYHNYMVQRVVEDLAASVLQLCDMPIDPEFAEKLPAAPYGFPCGFQKEFHGDRIKIPEGLFDLNYLRNANQSVLMSVSQVASTSCGMTDIDIRSSLYSNLVVTGGCSLMNGFVERLNHDLAHKCPATIKLRVNAAPTPQERRYGAWIGGSIVASLGSFQQNWVSRAEYDEAGKSVIEKKCVQ